MRNKGAAAAANVIRHTGCSRVNLSENLIRDRGIAAVAKAADETWWGPIESLDLSANQAGTVGVRSVSDLLIRRSRRVKRLDIQGMFENQDDGDAIACAVRERDRKGVLGKLILKDGNLRYKEMCALNEYIKKDVSSPFKLLVRTDPDQFICYDP